MLQVNYEAELSERVYADIADYVNQFPNYKASHYPCVIPCVICLLF